MYYIYNYGRDVETYFIHTLYLFFTTSRLRYGVHGQYIIWLSNIVLAFEEGEEGRGRKPSEGI